MILTEERKRKKITLPKRRDRGREEDRQWKVSQVKVEYRKRKRKGLALTGVEGRLIGPR